MSYESTNFLPRSARLSAVGEFLNLLGYERVRKPTFPGRHELAQYSWFEERDYRSFSGVWVVVSRQRSNLRVYTRTSISHSHWDVEQQVRTVRLLRAHFGGYFKTDEGKNRFWRCRPPQLDPSQSGCHIAFARFGSNLIKALIYLESRSFSRQQWMRAGLVPPFDSVNPRLLSNNLLLPFLVGAMEDYFKSMFVALLKGAIRKEPILKSNCCRKACCK